MKAQWSKLFVVTVVFVLLGGACAAPPPPAPPAAPPTATPIPPTPTPDPAAPVKAWVAALNSGDVDAALAPFTDDVTFAVFEYFASNKDELRGIFDWLAGLETKYQVTECQPKDGGVVCTMPVVDACIAGFGAAGGLPTKMEFSFQEDGKISKVSGNLEGGEWNNYFSKWVYPGTSWMQANRAEESAKVNAAASRREAGSIQTKLCKAYGESLKSAAATTSVPKQVLLVAQEQSEDMELMLTKEVGVMVDMLEKVGYKVVVASASGQPITGGATTLKPDLKLADVKVDDYAGFVFPCMAVDMDLPPPPEAVRIAEEALAQGKPVAAQVGGVVTLASAEVLNGKQFAFPEDPGAYMPGGIYKGTGVVQDGNIITSGTCPYMAREMGRTDGTPELTQKYIDLLAATQEATPAAATNDQLKVVQAYHAAISSGDVDAALSLLTDDAKLRGVYYGTGKEAVLWIFDWLVGQETKYGPADCQIQDERVVCAVTISDACIAAYGATGGLPWKGVYVVGQDGKIQEATETKEGAKWDDFDKFGQLVSAWAITNRADELPADGMNKDSGIAFAKLCKEYAASPK